MEFDVSIIIVNYHTSGLIADCVRSIYEKTSGIKYEIIIVDNNSEPDLPEIIGKLVKNDQTDAIRYVDLPENIGFGRANNEGVKIARGRNILFLNPDTLLINNAIKILSDFLDITPAAGACGANIESLNNSPTFSFWRLFPGILTEIDTLLGFIPSKIIFGKNIIYNHTGKPLEVAYVIGADLMVKRELIDKTGGFRKEFFMFCEETDLCLRIKKIGRKIYNVPEARIIHLEGQSFGETVYPTNRRLKMMEESRRTYQKLNQSKLNAYISNKIFSLNLNLRHLMTRDKAKKDYLSRRKKIFKSKS